jgi:hypothetical protein
MNGINNQYLIDSNIIIYHLNGEEIATKFLRENILNCFISRITFIEVLSFNFSINEKNDVLKLLNTFTIIDTNEDISLQTLKHSEILYFQSVRNKFRIPKVRNLKLVSSPTNPNPTKTQTPTLSETSFGFLDS